jgi:pimeloyl-ACP methyl ester carboxylesterase
VHGLTVDATRAGVAKTTVYRCRRSKDEPALAVFIDMVQQVTAVPELGDTRAELIAFVNRAVKILRSTLMGRVIQGSYPISRLTPSSRAFRERVVAVRLAEIRRSRSSVEHAVAMSRSLPDAERAVVPRTSHGLLHEKPELCNAIIVDFLTTEPVPPMAPVRRASEA